EIKDPLGLFLNSLLVPVRGKGHSTTVRFAHQVYQEFFLAKFIELHPGQFAAVKIPKDVEQWFKEPVVFPSAPLPCSDQAHVDGPEGGCWLWWKNTRHNIPKGTLYRMLAHMWNRDSTTYDGLYAAPHHAVYDDVVDYQTIRSDASELSGILRRIGIPW